MIFSGPLKLRYTIAQGRQRKERRLTVADHLTITQIVDRINAKNPGWRCLGWVPVKSKTK